MTAKRKPKVICARCKQVKRKPKLTTEQKSAMTPADETIRRWCHGEMRAAAGTEIYRRAWAILKMVEENERLRAECRHWSQRAHRAEDHLRTWLTTPFFTSREIREFRPAVERLLDEADNEDMPVLALAEKGDPK